MLRSSSSLSNIKKRGRELITCRFDDGGIFTSEQRLDVMVKYDVRPPEDLAHLPSRLRNFFTLITGAAAK
jgi:hypothetical protein